MASAAEQLAANLNLGVLSKATELKKRIWFTLGALVIYRLGTYIPVPGVDASVMAEMLQQHGGGILGMFDMFTGGALRRMTVFALNIMPYISASIIIQLMTAAMPSPGGAEEGRRAGAQSAQPVYALSDRGDCDRAVLRHLRSGWRACAAAAGAAVVHPGFSFLLHRGRDAGRRHDVPDVDGRADHRARHGQRHQPDHHVRHRRQPAGRAGIAAGTGPHRRAVDRCSSSASSSLAVR